MMQNHVQYIFNLLTATEQEILMAELIEIGFDGFEEKENELIAYILQSLLNEDALNEILKKHPAAFSKKVIEEKNWNAEWESNFQPVVIDDKITIRAHFHQPIKNIKHDIIITPKMSFGTGHHATTYMMVEQLLQLNINNKTVFDFGTGTGVLAILSEKLGAKYITAIDNDEWSINNATENIQQNNCTKIELSLSAHLPSTEKFDIVLANINKNIITGNFKSLVNIMKPKAALVLSGLLETDDEDILNLASHNNLIHIETKRRDKWILLQLNKQAL